MIPIEAKKLAVKAAWPDKIYGDTTLSEEDNWGWCFSRLTPAERTLAVECPICEEGIGLQCKPTKAEQVMSYLRGPHPERIAAVEREEAIAKSDREMNDYHNDTLHDEPAEQDDLGVEDLLVQAGTITSSEMHNHNVRRAFERGKKAGM